MHSFKSFLSNFLEVSGADWQIILPKLEHFNCSKGDVLTELGKIESNIYFLQKGAARMYYEKENKDITVSIGFPGSFISSYTSFLNREKSDFTLSTLTSCEGVAISHEALQFLYQNTECGHQLSRIVTEEFFLYLSRRVNDFLLKSPTERYLDMLEQQSRLIQEIPQKYLSSYIGITPQALSRIRAKLGQAH
ncbi:Crp/Fnr family transcriptional regulator [Bacteroidia bacterium]|nr:Crp/Fnr family transcriptional regulator [Bacteroidia bacterium]MDC1395266.1 Crp/Fnr family transcriptional regulator [Bacteroidia bacterium]